MIRNPAIIFDLYRSSAAALRQLELEREFSYYSDTAQLLSKGLLLACASYYEEAITEVVAAVVREAPYDQNVAQWLHRTAVEGRFFQWFDFRNARNTNRFLALFGDEFKERARKSLDAREVRRAAERSFLSLCVKRNECVHRNFAAYSIELSLEDVYREHRRAMQYLRFVDYALGRWLQRAQKRDGAR